MLPAGRRVRQLNSKLVRDLRQFAGPLRESSRLIGLAVRLTWGASRTLVLGIVLLALLQAVAPLAQLALLKIVIDHLAALAVDPAGLRGLRGLSGSDWQLPLEGAIALAAVAVGMNQLLQPFAVTLEVLASDRLTGHVMGQVIRRANSWHGMARFEDPDFADDLQRARDHAAQSGLRIVREGSHTAAALCAIGGLAITLASLHPLMPLVVLLGAIPRIVWEWEYLACTSHSLYIRTPESRRLRYFREVTLSADEAKDVRLYGLTPSFRQRYDDTFGRVIATIDRFRWRLTAQASLGAAIAALAVGTINGYVVWQALHGRFTAGDVALYGAATLLLQARLLDISWKVGVLPRELGFLPALERVLQAPPDLPLPERPVPVPAQIRQGIVFEEVWFAYPGHREPVLRGVSFTLGPEESLALVGQNGAGKTTIIKLLLRLYDPCAPSGSTQPPGRILLDGVDLRDYDLAALRRRIGVIFQDFVRYELTARENIAAGNFAALEDDQRLLQAAHKAGAAALIDGLPNGLDTSLGRQFGGRELSGGEWQKLALSRAFVRDCDLLVLDEPTAALDIQTEYEVYRRFQDLTRGRMTLLVSHRFSTVRMANHILYLDAGRIAEEGSHELLLRVNGSYARLYRLQASRYVGTATGSAPAGDVPGAPMRGAEETAR